MPGLGETRYRPLQEWWVNGMASQVMSLSGRAQLMGFPGYQTYF